MEASGPAGRVDECPARRAVEIRSLVPSDPFAGLTPRFGDDTKVLFVVEGPKAVAARQNVSVRTVFRRFRDGGRSPLLVRQQCRADVVSLLLKAGHPVGQVARAVGLSGPQALGRFVQGFFGLTPVKLRSQLQAQDSTLR